MTRFSGVRSVARNSAFLFATQATSIAIRFVYLFILARTLSPAAYGSLNYSLSWYLVVLPLTYLGADVVLARHIGRRHDGASHLLGSTLGMRVSAAVLVTGSLLAASSLREQDTYLKGLIALFSCALIGRSVWMWSASVFTAFEQAGLTLGFEIASRLLELCAVLLVLKLFGPDLYKIAIVHAFSWLLQGATSTIVAVRRYSPSFKRPGFEWLHLLREGAPGAVFSISTAIFFQLPIILFGQIVGPGNSLGYFALAFQVITYLVGIPTVIASASLPVLSRSAARRDGKDRLAAQYLVGGIILVGLGLVAAAWLVAGPVVAFSFGDRYAEAALVLRAGVWLLIPASIAMLFQNVLFSNHARSMLATTASLMGVAAMIILFPPFARSEGYVGALVAVGAGLGLWTFLAAAETFRIGFFKKRINVLRVK